MSLKRKNAYDINSSQKKAKSNFFAPRSSVLAGDGSKDSAMPMFTYTPKAAGTARLVTWNVNGVKSLDEKILKRYLEAEDPNIVVLTETKYSKGKPDIMCFKTRFKYQVWGTDPRPGHAGTAILSNIKPLNVIVGLPTWKDPAETAGRYVEFEFENIYIIGTYVPNSGEGFQTMDLKREWNKAFKSRIRELDTRKSVIWAGDFNCIPDKKDVDQVAQGFWNKMGGLSKEERADFNEILHPTDESHSTFVDAWRHLHPMAEEYTSKFGCWRLDSFIVSERALDQVVACDIRHDLKGLKLSDHWPATLDISTTL